MMRCTPLIFSLMLLAVGPVRGQGPADPYAGLLITEIVLAPVEHEGVEIYNSNSEGVIDLSGVILTDRQGTLSGEGQSEFPSGTMIAAGEYIWVFTAVSTAFIPDTSILPPGIQVFEEGESGGTFEGKPIPNLVNREGNITFSDLGDDASLWAPGTMRPIVPGENSDAVIDGVFSGITLFLGGSFMMGPDSPVQTGDIGIFAPFEISLQRLPTDQDTDRMIDDFVLGPITAGGPLKLDSAPFDPLTTALIADDAGYGHLTIVTGLPDSPEIGGRILTRTRSSEGVISPDGDTALTLDPWNLVLEVTQGLSGGVDHTTRVLTELDAGVDRLPAALRFAPDGTRATVGYYINGTLVTYLGLPTHPTPVGRIELPGGAGPDDLALSPLDPDLAVSAHLDLRTAYVIRGLTRRDPEIFAISTGEAPNGVAITPGGNRAIVCDTLSDTLTIIDDLTGTPHVSATLATPDGVGVGPQGIAVSPMGDVAVVTNSFGNTVSILTDLDGVTPRIVASLETTTFPVGVEFLPNGATAVVAGAVDPGITVIADLLPDPSQARVAANLIDPSFDVATFSEQSVLTFPPQPFSAMREDFTVDAAGWQFTTAEPTLGPVAAAWSDGALTAMSVTSENSFGSWYSPRGAVPLHGGALHAMRADIASNVADRSGVPATRLRLSTRDGSLTMVTGVASHGDAAAAPGTSPSSLWTLLALPPRAEDGRTPGVPIPGDLAWDLLQFDPTDAVPAQLHAERIEITRRTLGTLGAPDSAASFDFTADAQGWSFVTLAPTFAPAQGRSDPGELVIEIDGPDQVGFWESPPITALPTDHLLRLSFELRTDITARDDVPTVRLRAMTPDAQLLGELLLISAGGADFSPGGLPRRFDLFLAPPPVLRERGVDTLDIVAAFDVIALDPTDAPGQIFLSAVEVETFPLPPELQ